MKLRVLDIFSGCGGFSVGFHQAVPGRFETVLALDNNPAAVSTFNLNLSNGDSPVAVCVDVAEFSSSSEILAFYLAALNARTDDVNLGSELSRIGLRELTDRLAILDETYRRAAAAIATTSNFESTFRKLPDRERYSALFGEFLARYRFPAFSVKPVVAARMLWDVQTPFLKNIPRRAQSLMASRRKEDAAELKAYKLRIRRRIAREIQGIAEVFPTLGAFFVSDDGAPLIRNQVEWLARRTREIEHYFASPHVGAALLRLYDDRRRVHVLVGGPPCQGFSKWGRAAAGYLRRAGLHYFFDENFGDNRNRLFRNYVAFLDALRPDVFVFENVAAFDSAVMVDGRDVLRAGEALTAAVAALAESGATYMTASTLVNASRLGVPQNRERYIMLGFGNRSTSLGAAEILASLPSLEPVPVKLALAGLRGNSAFQGVPDPTAGWTSPKAPAVVRKGAAGLYTNWIRGGRTGGICASTDFHISRRPSPDDEAFFALLPRGVAWKEIPLPELRRMLKSINKRHHFLKTGYLAKRAGRHGDWLSRLDPGKPSRAICAHLGKDGYAYIHPHEPRTISVREAARIQTFPDWFLFGDSSLNRAFTLIGNAVPPLLAGHLAERISDALAAHDDPHFRNGFPDESIREAAE